MEFIGGKGDHMVYNCFLRSKQLVFKMNHLQGHLVRNFIIAVESVYIQDVDGDRHINFG
jgi:hypothetical protein